MRARRAVARHAVDAGVEAQVLLDGQVLVQAEALRHVADALLDALGLAWRCRSRPRVPLPPRRDRGCRTACGWWSTCRRRSGRARRRSRRGTRAATRRAPRPGRRSAATGARSRSRPRGSHRALALAVRLRRAARRHERGHAGVQLVLRVVDAHAHADDQVRPLALAEQEARRELGAREDVLDRPRQLAAPRRRRAASVGAPTRDAAASCLRGTNTSTYGCARSASVTAGAPGATISPVLTCTSTHRARSAGLCSAIARRAARRPQRAPPPAACARASAAAISSAARAAAQRLEPLFLRADAVRCVRAQLRRHVVDRRQRSPRPPLASCCWRARFLASVSSVARSAAISAALARSSSLRVPARSKRSCAWAAASSAARRSRSGSSSPSSSRDQLLALTTTSWPRSTATSSTRPPSSKPITRCRTPPRLAARLRQRRARSRSRAPAPRAPRAPLPPVAPTWSYLSFVC